jgi:hypothetical protein
MIDVKQIQTERLEVLLNSLLDSLENNLFVNSVHKEAMILVSEEIQKELTHRAKH